MKKGCLFDLDGTLVNSITDLALSTNEVLKLHHLPTHDISQYNMLVGNGVKKLMERALGPDHLDLLDVCLQDFQKIYREHCLDHTIPYDGIEELITYLKKQNIKLAVVTNKPHALAIQIVEHLFPDTFVAIYGQQDLYPVKPDPQSTYMALMEMRLDKKDCFFIGDSQVDIDTGYYADIDSIGVTWGFRGRQELENAGADYIVDNPYEIMELIQNENRG